MAGGQSGRGLWLRQGSSRGVLTESRTREKFALCSGIFPIRTVTTPLSPRRAHSRGRGGQYRQHTAGPRLGTGRQRWESRSGTHSTPVDPGLPDPRWAQPAVLCAPTSGT